MLPPDLRVEVSEGDPLASSRQMIDVAMARVGEANSLDEEGNATTALFDEASNRLYSLHDISNRYPTSIKVNFLLDSGLFILALQLDQDGNPESALDTLQLPVDSTRLNHKILRRQGLDVNEATRITNELNRATVISPTRAAEIFRKLRSEQVAMAIIERFMRHNLDKQVFSQNWSGAVMSAGLKSRIDPHELSQIFREQGLDAMKARFLSDVFNQGHYGFVREDTFMFPGVNEEDFRAIMEWDPSKPAVDPIAAYEAQNSLPEDRSHEPQG